MLSSLSYGPAVHYTSLPARFSIFLDNATPCLLENWIFESLFRLPVVFYACGTCIMPWIYISAVPAPSLGLTLQVRGT